ncbi:MAG: helix-turn-helix transcriptional regulator [Clostridia bacterium]|nr:helix-turn-helix transcriptional regulator [Clostridia bacterium]
MNIQLTLKTDSGNYNVFMSRGLYLPYTSPKHLHRHKYPEIHVVTGGNARFNINNKLYSAQSGTILVIPPDIFHCYLDKEKTAQRAAFQVDCDINEFAVYKISPDTVKDFFIEAEECDHSGNYSRLSAYIALFFSYVHPKQETSVQPLKDYGYLIQEFLSMHYGKDLHLRDLAEYLHLSERQVERLVSEHTGKTFREALTLTRMNIAKQLLKSTHMSLNEIAQYVGYKSYAGFWKAMKNHNRT